MAKDIEVAAYYRVILRAKEDTEFNGKALVRGRRISVEPVQMTFVLHERDVESLAGVHALLSEMRPQIHLEMIAFLKSPEAEHDSFAEYDELELLGLEEVLKPMWEYSLHPAGSYGIEPSNLLHIVD